MTARRCNDCTLCCTLLPVAEIAKQASTKCQHQRAKGCRIYRARNFPLGCSTWSCTWLLDPTLPLPRPDRAHYVIDSMPDFIEVERVGFFKVVQIWVDPRFPDAHRDPQLRTWLASRWESHEQVALVRFDSMAALALFPPQVTGGGWREQGGRASSQQHTPAEIVEMVKRHAK